MQLKLISKEEAHKMIDAVPGNTVMVIQYNTFLGLSNCGKHIKKWRSKKYVDQSSMVVLSQDDPIIRLNLHKKCFNDICNYNRTDRINKTKSILLPKL